MAGTLRISLLLTLVQLLATAWTSTAQCCPNEFNCDSFVTGMSPVPDPKPCTPTTLSVKGGWSTISAVKSCYALKNDEWFVVKCDKNQQCGIGASYLPEADNGIRFNQESVGFYWDAEMAFWGKPETPTPEGWNKKFSDRLVYDPSTPSSTLAVKIDYKTSTIWYRQSQRKPIDFKLPEPFHGKPLYAHVQVWNSNSMSLYSGASGLFKTVV